MFFEIHEEVHERGENLLRPGGSRSLANLGRAGPKCWERGSKCEGLGKQVRLEIGSKRTVYNKESVCYINVPITKDLTV